MPEKKNTFLSIVFGIFLTCIIAYFIAPFLFPVEEEIVPRFSRVIEEKSPSVEDGKEVVYVSVSDYTVSDNNVGYCIKRTVYADGTESIDTLYRSTDSNSNW
ncbi:MAG: hypothetical protein J6N49_02455 [Alphaproteobacteria bacterium]|nr:hypothetical protein [Alphaproteobacteria bacterium]